MTAQPEISGRSVIYLEDQLGSIRAITDYLENALGLCVTKCDNPEDAFEVMADNRFDLVILDIRILGGERAQNGTRVNWRRYGLYFLEELRKHRIAGPTTANVPVLVVTCVVSTPELETLHDVGTSAGGTYRYVAKPLPELGCIGNAVRGLLANVEE